MWHPCPSSLTLCPLTTAGGHPTSGVDELKKLFWSSHQHTLERHGGLFLSEPEAKFAKCMGQTTHRAMTREDIGTTWGRLIGNFSKEKVLLGDRQLLKEEIRNWFFYIQ
ncbi:hypothetical protein JTE90_011155 [Oedothorax gibbosus]|uniref:Uncharacterized protein n=1 Tax=Oedothorax gibbosus TaxID=931172 RepID=A0AAV6TZT0_9ARAC|nr:hypothetical protein JTE90_011155 [Oedothorax gibbosus]